MKNAPGNPAATPFRDPLQTVFLDRDGVINEKMPEGRFVAHWDEFRILPGVVEAIEILKHAGLRVVVVSNQRGVALGLYSAEDVRQIHSRFQALLAECGAQIDGFYFCPHNRGECACRKPLPGLFEQAQAEFPAISARSSIMIGDSKPDMEFGRRLGMITAFIEGDLARQKPGAEAARAMADLHYASLYEAALDVVNRLLPAQPVSGTMCLGFPANQR